LNSGRWRVWFLSSGQVFVRFRNDRVVGFELRAKKAEPLVPQPFIILALLGFGGRLIAIEQFDFFRAAFALIAVLRIVPLAALIAGKARRRRKSVIQTLSSSFQQRCQRSTSSTSVGEFSSGS